MPYLKLGSPLSRLYTPPPPARFSTKPSTYRCKVIICWVAILWSIKFTSCYGRQPVSPVPALSRRSLGDSMKMTGCVAPPERLHGIPRKPHLPSGLLVAEAVGTSTDQEITWCGCHLPKEKSSQWFNRRQIRKPCLDMICPTLQQLSDLGQFLGVSEMYSPHLWIKRSSQDWVSSYV